MAQAAWEKSPVAAPVVLPNGGRLKFLIGGVLILGAVVYLIISGTISGAQYFITVDQLLNDSTYVGQTVRVSGAVLGDTIQYDSRNLIIDFSIANIPTEFDDLGEALHLAVNDPTAARIPVRVTNQVKPDLLTNEAQAILSGRLGADGIFYADELLLKCPSRFSEKVPDAQAAGETNTDL